MKYVWKQIFLSLLVIKYLFQTLKGKGPNELKKRKKYTVLQNAGIVNDPVDSSYCYRWGSNG